MGKVTRNGKKVGRPEKSVSSEQKKTALRAAYLGMPEDRVAVLCGFSCGNPAGWGAYLSRHPDFKRELESARVTGEVEMQGRVLDASNGWQGAAWLLERTRGYVARAQLDHTTKGKELSVSGSLLGALIFAHIEQVKPSIIHAPHLGQRTGSTIGATGTALKSLI